MKNQEKADALLAGLCDLVGVQNTGFDAGRMFAFKINDQYRITLLANSEDRLFLYAFVGFWPKDPPETFAADLLTANLAFAHQGGPYLACDLPSQSLILSYSLELASTTPDSLRMVLENLVIYQMHLIKIFSEKKIVLEQPQYDV